MEKTRIRAVHVVNKYYFSLIFRPSLRMMNGTRRGADAGPGGASTRTSLTPSSLGSWSISSRFIHSPFFISSCNVTSLWLLNSCRWLIGGCYRYLSDMAGTVGDWTLLTWDTWKLVAGTPGRRVEATSWCRCRGWLSVLVLYLVVFMAKHLASTQAF